MQVNILSILPGSPLSGMIEKTAAVKNEGPEADFVTHMNRSIRESESDAAAGTVAGQKAASPGRDARGISAKSVKRIQPASGAKTESGIDQSSEKPAPATQTAAEQKGSIKEENKNLFPAISAAELKDVIKEDEQNSSSIISAAGQKDSIEENQNLFSAISTVEPKDGIKEEDQNSSSIISAARLTDAIKEIAQTSSDRVAVTQDSSQDGIPGGKVVMPSYPADSVNVDAASAPGAESNPSPINMSGEVVPEKPEPSDALSAGFASNSAPNSWQIEAEKPATNMQNPAVSMQKPAVDIQEKESAAAENAPRMLPENQEIADLPKSGEKLATVISNKASNTRLTPKEKELENESGAGQSAQITMKEPDAESEIKSASGTASNNEDASQQSMPDQNPVNPKHDARKAPVAESGSENMHTEKPPSAKETAPVRTAPTMSRGAESAPSEAGVQHTRLEDRSQTNSFQPALNTARTADAGVSISSASAQVAPAQSKEFILQVADHIQVQVRNGKGEIRIQLRPESLGRMEIKAENSAAGVVARITTESHEVRSYLENNMHVLQQSLQDQGLKVDRIEFAVQNGFENFTSSGDNPQSGHAGSGNNGGDKKNSAPSAGVLIENQIEADASDALTRVALNPNIHFHTVA